jgi:hypothetical protein
MCSGYQLTREHSETLLALSPWYSERLCRFWERIYNHLGRSTLHPYLSGMCSDMPAQTLIAEIVMRINAGLVALIARNLHAHPGHRWNTQTWKCSSFKIAVLAAACSSAKYNEQNDCCQDVVKLLEVWLNVIFIDCAPFWYLHYWYWRSLRKLHCKGRTQIRKCIWHVLNLNPAKAGNRNAARFNSLGLNVQIVMTRRTRKKFGMAQEESPMVEGPMREHDSHE